MKKLFVLFSVLFFISCKNTSKESSLIASGNKNIQVEYKFKTFVEVQRKANDYLVFKPCDGATRKLKWNKNNLLEITEKNEDGVKEILKGEYLDNGFRIYITELDYYDFFVYDKKKEIFEVKYTHKSSTPNHYTDLPKFVVDSLNTNNFKLFNQPCIECYTEEQCIALGEIPATKKSKESYKISEYLTHKESKILIKGEEIKILIPFVVEHIDSKGDDVWGKNEISSNLMVKMIRGKKRNLFSVDGEGKCGACPNFSAFYSIDGDLLCYAYSVRVSAYEGKTLLEKGDFEKVMSDYGITNEDLNIQYNHPDTPTYMIRDWFD